MVAIVELSSFLKLIAEVTLIGYGKRGVEARAGISDSRCIGYKRTSNVSTNTFIVIGSVIRQ